MVSTQITEPKKKDFPQVDPNRPNGSNLYLPAGANPYPNIAPASAQASNPYQLIPQQPTTTKPVDNSAPPNVPRLPDGSINPLYVPGSNLPKDINNFRTGGQSLQEQMRIEQQTQQSNKAREIATAFDYVLQNPLPSTFEPQGINYAGVGRASLNSALSGQAVAGGVGALTGALLSGVGTGAAAGSVVPGVGTAIGAVVGGVAAIVGLSALKGGINEIQNQRADTIQLAVKNYDRAEEIRIQLIKLASNGGDPYELIEQYKLVEQAKVTAREQLEYASLRDPSGFSDKARAQLNAMKQQETQELRYLRNQRFLKAMQNPSMMAPEVVESPALISETPTQ